LDHVTTTDRNKHKSLYKIHISTVTIAVTVIGSITIEVVALVVAGKLIIVSVPATGEAVTMVKELSSVVTCICVDLFW
jgi:hypothetical protein